MAREELGADPTDPEPNPRRRKKHVAWKVLYPDLSVEQILEWADAHHARTGEWPKANSGAVFEAPRETWMRIMQALLLGYRGLERGSSLARVLQLHRGVRNRIGQRPLTVDLILQWADAHLEVEGELPHAGSGVIHVSGIPGETWFAEPISDAPGENWRGIDSALRKGHRGLAGGLSLLELRQSERERLGLPREPAREPRAS